MPELRKFDTGATRDTEDGKFDYEGFLSPLALDAYATYMHAHRQQTDGSLRASDNWQKGFPLNVYMKSLWRHVIAAWSFHRGYKSELGIAPMEDALCGIIFNAFGYLHEIKKEQSYEEVNSIRKLPPEDAWEKAVQAQTDKETTRVIVPVLAEGPKEELTEGVPVPERKERAEAVALLREGWSEERVIQFAKNRHDLELENIKHDFVERRAKMAKLERKRSAAVNEGMYEADVEFHPSGIEEI